MTNPAMRDLIMQPRNPLGAKTAVLSLLAGDIYGRTPIWASLWLFKAIYWVNALLQAPRSWRAWRRRRDLIADVGALPGETVMAERR
jgi:hypothetical protein